MVQIEKLSPLNMQNAPFENLKVFFVFFAAKFV